jgi:hypothetical protein
MFSKIATLELLEYVLFERGCKLSNLSNVAIISVQHLVESTGSLFKSIITLGIAPENIWVTGKLYSNNTLTIKRIKALGIQVQNSSDSSAVGSFHNSFLSDCVRLWESFDKHIAARGVQRIIILDDGGHLISTLPDKMLGKYCLIGVEQTTSGIELNRSSKISIVNVAGSAIKRYVEPAFISQAVLQKLRRYLLNSKPTEIGIIGLGNIGTALARDLSSYYSVSVFDNHEQFATCDLRNVKIKSSADELFYDCDLVIGATGTDISKEHWLKTATTDKTLISVSSGDIEFKRLLTASSRYLDRPIHSSLDNVIIQMENGHTLTILRGGTPINFDNNLHSVLPEYIQLTRALLLLGVIQAIEESVSLCERKLFVKLNASWQRKILKHWVESVDHSKFRFNVSVDELLNEKSFIEQHSLGSF